MAPTDTVSIGGVDPFKEGLEGVVYLGLEWVLNPIVRTDIDVPTLLKSVGGDYFSERRDELSQYIHRSADKLFRPRPRHRNSSKTYTSDFFQ